MDGGATPNLPLDMGNNTQPAPQTAVDFWDLGASEAHQPMTQDYEFSEVVNVQPVEKSNTVQTLLVALLALGVIGGAGWFVYTSEEDPVQMIMNLVNGESSDPNTATPNTTKNDAKKKKGQKKAVAGTPDPAPAANQPQQDSRIAGNPYWYLPNEIEGDSTSLNRTWTPEEEELWRSGMAHPFNYQRFKTVKDVREARLRGSEAILWDALNQPKFWTRMWALIGLAEFNIPVSLQVVEETLGDARAELVADYFERFIEKSTPGQRYIMRQSLRLLDEKARLNILKALDKANDNFRDLYLVAGSLDPAPRVQRFVERALARRPVSNYNGLAAVVESGDPNAEIPNEPESTISEAAMQQTATGAEDDMVPVDSDLEAMPEGEYDDYGAVEFYEEAEVVEDDEVLDEESIDDYGDYGDYDANF